MSFLLSFLVGIGILKKIRISWWISAVIFSYLFITSIYMILYGIVIGIPIIILSSICVYLVFNTSYIESFNINIKKTIVMVVIFTSIYLFDELLINIFIKILFKRIINVYFIR